MLFIFDKCEKSFKTKSEMKNHDKHIQVPKVSIKGHKCEKCETVLVDESELTKHIKTHRPNASFALRTKMIFISMIKFTFRICNLL